MDALHLFTQIKDWVAHAARSFSVGVLTHEDLTHEAYIVCHEVMLKYSSADENGLTAIVKRSIKNRFVDLYRYHSFRGRFLADELPDQIPGYVEVFSVLVAKEMVEFIRDKLNKQERVVFNCLIDIPDGVMFRAVVEYDSKAVSGSEVKIYDRHFADYLEISNATMSRCRESIRLALEKWKEA